MLYDEFIQGTGCKQNEHNYKVYKDLEIMYMNSDLSKEEVYEYGKKLVDNSKSVKEIEYEKRIKAEIADLKTQLAQFQADAKMYMGFYNEDKTDTYWKSQAKWKKELAQDTKNKIRELKWILQL